MAIELKQGTVLKGSANTYLIEKCLGQGGFGITYYGTTKMQGPLGEIDIPVAVKEFFMSDYSERDEATGRVSEPSRDGVIAHYRRKFKVEAQNLAKMKDCPGIVNVLEVFEANNTVYYTMQFVNGQDLDSYISKQPRGRLTEKEAIDIIVRVGEALQFMHEHDLLHLDVKPKNIMMEQGTNKPFLIDFGLSKQYDEYGNAESSTNVGGGTAGYSPMEQNSSTGFAPTLDVYALGATLYKCLIGQRPPEATEVMEEGLPVDRLKAAGVSDRTISIIESAMQPRKKDRPQTMAEFVALLRGQSAPSKPSRPAPARPNYASESTRVDVSPRVQPQKEVEEEYEEGKGFLQQILKNKMLLSVIAVFVVIIACMFIFNKNSDNYVPPASTPTTEDSDAVVVPTDTAPAEATETVTPSINESPKTLRGSIGKYNITYIIEDLNTYEGYYYYNNRSKYHFRLVRDYDGTSNVVLQEYEPVNGGNSGTFRGDITTDANGKLTFSGTFTNNSTYEDSYFYLSN